jgi:hypothetical protein
VIAALFQERIIDRVRDKVVLLVVRTTARRQIALDVGQARRFRRYS